MPGENKQFPEDTRKALLRNRHLSWVMEGPKEFARLKGRSFPDGVQRCCDFRSLGVLRVGKYICFSMQCKGEARRRLRPTCEGPSFPTKEFRFYSVISRKPVNTLPKGGAWVSLFFFLGWQLYGTSTWKRKTRWAEIAIIQVSNEYLHWGRIVKDDRHFWNVK